MSEQTRELAKTLALRPYIVEIRQDETTDGEPVYLALNPELNGCLGQGKSIEEALSDLDSARIDFIESMLDDGLTVPDPFGMTTTGSQSVKNIVEEICPEKSEKCNEVLFLLFA
jgi:predicted RNase H-like HicB family nuclease